MKKVYIVDESNDYSKDLQKEVNAEVFYFNNSETALDEILKHRPDVVITDLLLSKIDGFDTIRSEFMGFYNGPERPQAVLDGACRNSVASGWSPVAAQQINVLLAPGETRSFVFVLAYIENPEDEKWAAGTTASDGIINKERAHALLAKYRTDSAVTAAYESLHAYWDQLLSRFTVRSANEKVDRMVNTWNPRPTMSPASDAAWASVIPVRIFLASCT